MIGWSYFGEMQLPQAMALATCTTCRGALTPRLPLLPSTKQLFMAMPWTSTYFLGVKRSTSSSAVGGIGENAMNALSFTVAFAAETPILPIAEGTVYRIFSATRIDSTLCNFG